MKEADLWATLKKQAGIHVPTGHIERIENAVGRGTPDVNYCLRGVEGWIELKHVQPRSDRIALRPTQVVWLRQRAKAGGYVWVMARRGDAVRVWSGADAGDLVSVGWRLSPVLETLKPFDWRAVFGLLSLSPTYH